MTLTHFLAGRLLVGVKTPTPEVGLYRQVRTLAQREAFLRPFAKHMLGVRLPVKLSQAPHPMSIKPHVVTKRLANNLHASVVCRDAADTRRWLHTLSAMQHSGTLDSLGDGEEKLLSPVTRTKASTLWGPDDPKLVLVHEDKDDREQFLKKERSNSHLISNRDTTQSTIDNTKQQQKSHRLKK